MDFEQLISEGRGSFVNLIGCDLNDASSWSVGGLVLFAFNVTTQGSSASYARRGSVRSNTIFLIPTRSRYRCLREIATITFPGPQKRVSQGPVISRPTRASTYLGTPRGRSWPGTARLSFALHSRDLRSEIIISSSTRAAGLFVYI